ncbi:hypothetical protein [Saccharibacillus kuerlensis]|uniref:Uncharacterized protein n=1 Tax=Saccharibacillus kuerlensis TaxID=459527 RepID=A0ABQ2L525_9BACL|nr:hypothetical protein [Saccharibacillus kuerlensis]GGO03914.1 hypothetical protein GCM10010969_28580 [Saccharibacillus kuerlensis]
MNGLDNEKDRAALKSRLEEELADTTFTSHTKVLQRTHPSSRRAGLHALWNRELEFTVKPGSLIIGTAALLLLLASPYAVHTLHNTPFPSDKRELIEAGGNVYWEDIYRKEVKRLEN